MTDFHVKDLYANASRTKLISSTGTAILNDPRFFYKDQALLRFTITDSNGDPVVLTGGSFQFRIISSYSTQNLLTNSDDSQFISGDWVDYSEAGGMICCRVDFNKAAILTYLAATRSKKAYCGLWATLGGVKYLLAQFNCDLYNSISL